jgi:F-type H+-transporting ATPase subunit b
MEDTLQALGGILLRAIPTFLLVIGLHFYLKSVFFRPLERVLSARFEATEGARQLAEQSLAKAAAREAEHQAAIRAARAEIYQEQEQLRRSLEEERSNALNAARKNVEARIDEAKAQIAAEVAEAKQNMAADSERLANQIADSILRRRAA